jgi:DNA-binding CsgD family transcriptional regulator
MCVVRDPRWAEEIVAVGRENPPILDRSIVENDAVVEARATLVHDVQGNPRVNRPLAEITRSSSYGIAPLLVDGEVVGLLHGDYYHQGRLLRPEDQQLLSVFATGVSQTLARLTVLDGLARVRAQFDGLIGRGVPRVGQQVELIANRSVLAAHASDDEVLTRREAQIMRMVAAGDSNGRISRRLVISEATVKSHMTHILRKLNAANRAEAVSLWLHSGANAGA